MDPDTPSWRGGSAKETGSGLVLRFLQAKPQVWAALLRRFHEFGCHGIFPGVGAKAQENRVES